MISNGSDPVVRVENLTVQFGPEDSPVTAVHNASFTIGRGETRALVGESGSGKTVTALSVLQLLPDTSRTTSGQVFVGSTEMIGATEPQRRAIRGQAVGTIFQEPMTFLNPLHSIERQVGESLLVHKGLTEAQSRDRVIELLELVGLPDPQKRLTALPHELSGGQRQRVMIAMALALEPALLIADEPTTALDVTIQAQILELLETLQEKMGMAILFITHDLNIVRRIADSVCVMKGGEIVEQGDTAAVFSDPQHAYTQELLSITPQPKMDTPVDTSECAIEADQLRVWFPIRAGVLRRTVDHVKAVNSATLSIKSGHTVGVVGESGSGKTTLALALLKLIDSEGRITFQGQQIDTLDRGDVRPLRRDMQIIFQDPFGSLSPRLSVGQIVGEGLDVHGIGANSSERYDMVVQALEDVGLDADMIDRYPHEFSGGQRQRISIARAIVLRPKLVVLDEPTSALDVSVQAQIIDLLKSLQAKFKLTYIFISHDLRVVRAISDQILVMKDGNIIESGPASDVFDSPSEPYTKALLSAAVDMRT